MSAESVRFFLLIAILALIQISNAGKNSSMGEVHFQLFTRQNPSEPQILQSSDRVTLQNSLFNTSLPTKIFVHGYGASPLYAYPIRNGYLFKEDLNLIMVDWSTMAKGSFYDVATKSIPWVGNLTGKFINFLLNYGAELDKIHLIGHSFGSHVCGFAGAAISPRKIARITALDPNLVYEYFPPENLDSRLDPSDAQFVDVIHTNRRSTVSIGHVEFLPNGGENQPGCEIACCCSHMRAFEYFTESITTKVGFRSVRCSSWEKFQTGACDGNESALMGANAPKTLTGSFYLRTKKTYPFAAGELKFSLCFTRLHNILKFCYQFDKTPTKKMHYQNKKS